MREEAEIDATWVHCAKIMISATERREAVRKDMLRVATQLKSSFALAGEIRKVLSSVSQGQASIGPPLLRMCLVKAEWKRDTQCCNAER